mmetsp:Transcript_4912/g.8985  ORF Transcript_4912/g.8985 Transcript_4912/m.8985 type:complete len:127 (-) Transcript_4912:509-889(-)
MNTRMLLLASVALFALASAKDAARTQTQAVLSSNSTIGMRNGPPTTVPPPGAGAHTPVPSTTVQFPHCKSSKMKAVEASIKQGTIAIDRKIIKDSSELSDLQKQYACIQNFTNPPALTGFCLTFDR